MLNSAIGTSTAAYITVYLIAQNFERQTTTDSSGKFSFEDVPAGIYIVRAEYGGYIPSSDFIVVEPNTANELQKDLVLYPETGEYGSVEGYAKYIDGTDHSGISWRSGHLKENPCRACSP